MTGDHAATPELPWYKCHKFVQALKIVAIQLDSDRAKTEGRDTDGSAVLFPKNQDYIPFKVSAEYMSKHQPQIGGYYVKYRDGYVSYSPCKAFESGYIHMEDGLPV